MSGRLVARLTALIDALLARSGYPHPPFVPALALAPTISPFDSPASSSSSRSIGDLVREMSVLWGVPKTRTTKPVKATRKFSYTRIMAPITGIVTCPSCGSKHLEETICGTCYEKVREVTNSIKEKMMAYNPYKGDRQDKEVFLRFSDDVKDGEDEGVVKGKRVIELERPRPSWFKRIFPNK
ncbi:unnamed protein product, partial [Mesorhabditis belari]|uniref:Large ribosomal subunit protein bL32m n=1 Tax=Mesorhabditis belari TaxID=2138241 RepID=A0AAF3JCD0_9BILA